MEDAHKGNPPEMPEPENGSGVTGRSIINNMRTLRATAFREQLAPFAARAKGRGSFSKKQIEDMTSGFESGFTDAMRVLVEMGVIRIVEEL